MHGFAVQPVRTADLCITSVRLRQGPCKTLVHTRASTQEHVTRMLQCDRDECDRTADLHVLKRGLGRPRVAMKGRGVHGLTTARLAGTMLPDLTYGKPHVLDRLAHVHVPVIREGPCSRARLDRGIHPGHDAARNTRTHAWHSSSCEPLTLLPVHRVGRQHAREPPCRSLLIQELLNCINVDTELPPAVGPLSHSRQALHSGTAASHRGHQAARRSWRCP